MLSLTTHLDTIRPATWQKINQVGLLILIGSAAFAPAWLNIIAVTGFGIMNFYSFKQLCLSIIRSILGRDAAPQTAPASMVRYPDVARPARPNTGNVHRYYGDGLHGRYGNMFQSTGRHGVRIDRQFGTTRRFRKGGNNG